MAFTDDPGDRQLHRPVRRALRALARGHVQLRAGSCPRSDFETWATATETAARRRTPSSSRRSADLCARRQRCRRRVLPRQRGPLQPRRSSTAPPPASPLRTADEKVDGPAMTLPPSANPKSSIPTPPRRSWAGSRACRPAPAGSASTWVRRPSWPWAATCSGTGSATGSTSGYANVQSAGVNAVPVTAGLLAGVARLAARHRRPQLPAGQDGGPGAPPRLRVDELDPVFPVHRRPQGGRAAVRDRRPGLPLHRRPAGHGHPDRAPLPDQPRLRPRHLHRGRQRARHGHDDDGHLGRRRTRSATGWYRS